MQFRHAKSQLSILMNVFPLNIMKMEKNPLKLKHQSTTNLFQENLPNESFECFVIMKLM